MYIYKNISGTCTYKVYKIMCMYMTSYYMYVVCYLSCFCVSFTEVTLLERFNIYCYNKILSIEVASNKYRLMLSI